ncbi:MAG: hypothetical protein CMI60_08980 [Parvibaculum sp.]|nr:hypothetical protein [Parvibaculum sp.]
MKSKKLVTREVMRQLIDKFCEVHEDGVRDHIGPNAGDAPFFKRLHGHEDIPETMYQEAAERFYKYSQTQIPTLMKWCGIPEHVDVQSFLKDMTAIGVKAKAKAAYQSKLASRLRQFFKETGKKPASLRDVMSFDEEVMAMCMEFMTEHGDTINQPNELKQLYEETLASYIVTETQARLRNTVKAEVYEDMWYSKNDSARRWPKKSRRVSLRFPRHTAVKDELKSVLGFPAIKWNGEFWSLTYTEELLSKAAAIFEKHGFYAEQLTALAVKAPTPDTSKAVTDKNVSATIEADVLVLKWPWLQDADLRGKVMSIVKGVMGRKWDGSRKAWKVPISQGAFLKGRLDGIYQPLADAIATVDGMSTVIESQAERIALSSAASLHDEEKIEEMRSRLAEQFPEGRELYPFQYVGVRFCELAGGRALIGDDMGVGKTIQALAYAALHPENHPVLVVAPANVKYNWVKEFTTWLPNLSVEAVKNGKSDIPDTDVVVINYDLMKKQQLALEDAGFNIVIFDESHYLKNSKAQRTQASLEVANTSKDIICLSGTAITNRPIEFFTTLNLLRPVEFGNFFTYGKRYCDAHHTGWGWDFKGSSNESELHERTRAFTIRRLKKEVMDELPDKIRQVVDVVPTPAEQKTYKNAQAMWLNQYEMHKAQGSLPAGFVLNMLTELRHHCGTLKITATANWVREYREVTGKPTIIFAHHKDVVDGLVDELKDDFTLGLITGSVAAEKRQERVDAFQRGDIDVMICSTVAAKEGLTLTRADTVVFIEREWSPAWEEQAEDRVNRIGQDAETVHAVYLSVKGTIDEKFNSVVEEKRAVIQSVLDGGDAVERKGIASALLKSMVDSGDIPVDMLRDLGVGA